MMIQSSRIVNVTLLIQIHEPEHKDATGREDRTKGSDPSTSHSSRCRSLPRPTISPLNITFCVAKDSSSSSSSYYAVLVLHPTRAAAGRHARASVTCAPRPLLSRAARIRHACACVHVREYRARTHTYLGAHTHACVHTRPRVSPRSAAPTQRHPEYRM